MAQAVPGPTMISGLVRPVGNDMVPDFSHMGMCSLEEEEGEEEEEEEEDVLAWSCGGVEVGSAATVGVKEASQVEQTPRRSRLAADLYLTTTMLSVSSLGLRVCEELMEKGLGCSLGMRSRM